MPRPANTKISLIGFMGVTGLGFTVILPILIGAIVDQMQLDRSMVGWIASANIGGLTIGALIATLLIGRLTLTSIIRIGCVGLLLLDFLSAHCVSQEELLALRFLSGVAGGMVYAASLAAFSGLKNSVSAFSIYIICYAAVSGITLLLLPYMIAVWGYKSGFYLLCLMDLISLATTGIVSQFESLIRSRNFESLPKLISKPAISMTLISYLLLQMAGGLVYTYCERIGREVGLGIEFIGIVLSLGAVVAFTGAYAVIRIGNRFGTARPVFIGISLMILFFLLMFWSEYKWIYLVAMCFSGAAWSFTMPFYQQLQAGFDEMGRVVSVGTIVNMGGRAVGPALAAVFLSDYAFSSVIWVSVVSLVIALVIILSVVRGEPD